jgi:hypothetical protein
VSLGAKLPSGAEDCQIVAGLLIWGVLSDETTGLSFKIAAGPRQRIHIYRVWTLAAIMLDEFNANFYDRKHGSSVTVQLLLSGSRIVPLLFAGLQRIYSCCYFESENNSNLLYFSLCRPGSLTRSNC